MGGKLHEEHSFWKEKRKSMSLNGTLSILDILYGFFMEVLYDNAHALSGR